VFFYIKIASKYIIVAREIRRISSTSQSPVLDQFSSVLSGLSTIRAFGRADFYMSRMHSLIDNKAKAEMASTRSFLWLSFRLGMLGVVFVTVVAYAVAVGGANAALAGFSLTFALQYTGALGGLLHGMTSIELGFNAVERVVEYAEIETEPEGGIDAPAAWPTEGRIEVDHLTVSYAEGLPDVLQDVNFTIGAGERVGVVGRTGAGKSTLAAVLFRLLEPKTGSVRIDNIDISTLKLDHLRSRLAIIPQDPFLFSGTLRSNLDMEGHLDDYDLHQALQRVHLVEEDDSTPETPTQQPSCNDGTPTPTTNKNLFANLSHPITSGGANLSQGQRQLCCLARALLRRPKLVVLDEATSAVDRATDAAIQISLRREFAGCTVLVVAHRLSTVADFDRLLVLDGGRVAEMGTPEELLRRGMEREEEAGDVDGRDGAKTDNAVGDSRGTNGEFDGTGAFWELVKKSAEKEKLMGMIFGKKGEAGPP
jgi:ABC-type multidrug transport system fused ATPase/permease subunit